MPLPADGHSPITCNYFNCRAKSREPCPFLKDKKPSLGLHDAAAEIKRINLEHKVELLDELRDVLRRILEQD